ncbi:OB-fold putative lipoprotein [Winogradskyella immobilis]|uniref:tRNA_anti-like n=1 Tax=Winogradskyella immobilis TaxID=2816852 RepID=A0ABS8ELY5_9FLAO|nr:OB-fold putative lipoprotein [Winogradskyella immobilis]MCC1483575.1 hypothetical protein [Winogradskyella immobilis]MCG0015669.1 OB-fold putative lipoprotein [Winogradskyella immobilis]
MKKYSRVGLVVVFILVIIAVVGYNYIYQDHRDIASEKPAYTISAEELTQQFEADEAEATTLYLNNTIQLSGLLTSIDEKTLVLDNVVFLVLSENETTPNQTKLNTKITIKGRCIGYDNLLGEVKLDQAIIVD